MVTIIGEETAHPAPEDFGNNSSVLRSLVVDDDFVTLKTVCRMLNALGCDTDSANCGEAAMQCLEESWYDFVLTDWNMPDIHGCEIAKWLRRHAGQTKIIIMTGSSPAEVLEHKENGAADFWLFKPFNLDRLAQTLRDLYHRDAALYIGKS